MSELNPYTNGPLGLIFAKTAAPIIFVMGMNGLLTVVDAMFLGRYVGADALGAVTLIFPLFMLTIALATLVSNGMSSILARDLGARDLAAARAVYSSACGLALLVAGLLIAGYLLFGRLLSLTLANGVVPLADMGQTYLAITAWLSPLAFVLAVNLDALRNEGHVGMMAAMSVLVSTSNIGFNYVLIAMMGLGVAGSAIGTGLAQLLALIIIIAFRATGRTTLRPRDMLAGPLTRNWAGILALGAPQSLSFLGIAIGTAAVIAALQFNTVVEYETTVSAYGIVTRPITFAFLPLLGLTYAMQTIVGNNFGAQAWHRSDHALRIALITAFVYSTAIQVILTVFPAPIAAAFTDDPAVIAAFARITPLTIPLFWLAGPLIMIAGYFQAIGDPLRAALLGLAKPYAFAIPLTFVLPLFWGQRGIWLASPAAEAALLGLTLWVLMSSAQKRQLRWGLFTATPA
tara:strand:+ start:3282 stop:4658 length:1377 start_codon:yes stop_codon:yes gene_type:complete